MKLRKKTTALEINAENCGSRVLNDGETIIYPQHLRMEYFDGSRFSKRGPSGVDVYKVKIRWSDGVLYIESNIEKKIMDQLWDDFYNKRLVWEKEETEGTDG